MSKEQKKNTQRRSRRTNEKRNTLFKRSMHVLRHRSKLNKSNVKEKPNKERDSEKKKIGFEKKSAKELEKSNKKKMRTAEE